MFVRNREIIVWDNDRERMEADMLITNKHYRQNLKTKRELSLKWDRPRLCTETGETDLLKLEQLVRVLLICAIRQDVVLVSSVPLV